MASVYKSGVPSPEFFLFRDAVLGLAGEGVEYASQHDIADRAGKKVTDALRNAMQEMEYQGIVTKKKTRSNLGGLMVVYELHPHEAQMPMRMPVL